MNQKYDVDEIFYSIQGEGVYSGSPMIFVRLTGCNLSCDWCLGPNTLIQLISGGASKIKDIRAGDVLLGYDETSGTLQPTTVVTTKQHGGKERWSIKPSSSQTTIATPDHLWMVDGSWKRTDHLETGDEIWTSGNLNYSSWRMRRDNPSRLPGAHDRLSARAKRLFGERVLSAGPLHPKSIGPLRGDSSVYDITCLPFPTFFANGLLTHNCDTKYALEASDRTRHLTPEEIALEAKKLSTKATRICITGGEPTLQPIGPLLAHLSLGWTVHIETNGTIPRSPGLIQYYIVLSPKRELAPHSSMLEAANEIKLVVDVPDFFESEFFKPYLEMSHSQITLRHITFSLQPENNRREMGKLCVEFIKENPQWRLSLQTHKLLGVR